MEYNNLTTAGRWFSSITTAQKEHIARKILEGRQRSQGVKDPEIPEDEYRYPRCTTLFMSLGEAQQQAIRSHCLGRHGFTGTDEFEGWMFSE